MTLKNGKKRKNSMVVETLGLKKPTALDRIIEKIPKPEGAVPNFGLPKWKLLPLESKIPVIPAPKDAYNLSRQKLGKKLWIQTKNADFDLSDPYNYEIEYSYDSMHDEHLARYFTRQNNIRHLLKRGLISKNLDALCSVKDYNMHRKFLRKLHSESINQEFKRQWNFDVEKRILGFADMAAKKEIERLKKEERQKLERAKVEEELRLQKEKTEQESKEKTEKMMRRIEAIEEAEGEGRNSRIMKFRSKAERARRKRAQISEIKQGQIVRSVIERARKDANVKKTQKKRKAEKAKEKRREIEEKWERRKEEQEIEIARIESALRYVENEREKFIKNYTNKVERERAKLQKRVKNYSKFLSCYLARKVADPGENTCCQNSSNQLKDVDEEDPGNLSTAEPKSTSEIFKVTTN